MTPRKSSVAVATGFLLNIQFALRSCEQQHVVYIREVTGFSPKFVWSRMGFLQRNSAVHYSHTLHAFFFVFKRSEVSEIKSHVKFGPSGSYVNLTQVDTTDNVRQSTLLLTHPSFAEDGPNDHA